MNIAPLAVIGWQQRGRIFMEELDILLGGQAVGTAQVSREGLYLAFRCRCHLSGEAVYRLQVRCGDRSENLGIPVPRNGTFELNTRVPAKRLGPGKMVIEAVPKKAEPEGMFVPLGAEEPFRYLRRLEEAFLQVREGQVGIILPPECPHQARPRSPQERLSER